jgi:Asp/Glu/hydantoin racemase
VGSGFPDGDEATVAVIQTMPTTIAPVTAALAERFPEARPWHLMDGRLLEDAEAAGGLTPPLARRMLRLVEHAVEGGADAVLIGCSIYAPVAETARGLWTVPVMASDEAMHRRVADDAGRRVVLLGSFATAVADAAARLRETLRARGVGTDLVEVTAAGAFAAAASGDRGALAESLVSAASAEAGDADAFVLCQYSLTQAYDALEAAIDAPVHSPLHLAADALRELLRA